MIEKGLKTRPYGNYTFEIAEKRNDIDSTFQVQPITATKQFNGIAGRAKLIIDLADPAAGIQNPFIVVEGFDPGILIKPENEFGISNINNFNASVQRANSDDLRNLLSDEEMRLYDIIYVDWENGVDYIQRNAFVLEAVIEWVNAQKAANGSTAPNVVMGQSMGGVVARYALRDMENNNQDHDTSLYISHDAPHQGANVPIGYQFFSRHAFKQYVQAPLLNAAGELIVPLFTNGVTPQDYLSLQDTPAAKQMLINYIERDYNVNNTVHDTWQTHLTAFGYPQDTRNIAISNGSHCALPQNAGAGDQLFSINGRYSTGLVTDIYLTLISPGLNGALFTSLGAFTSEPGFLLGILPGGNRITLDFKVNALPNSGTQRIYKGKVTYRKTILFLVPVNVNITDVNKDSPPNTLPFDSYPGGLFDTGIRNDDDGNSNNFWQKLLFKYNISTRSNPTFSFVPTASALDVGRGQVPLTNQDYLFRYNSANPPLAPKDIPFQNFITSFQDSFVIDGADPDNIITSNNEMHIFLHLRNANWLAAELQALRDPVANNPQIFNCTPFCSEDAISGPDFVCGSETYTIPLIPDTTYNWFVNNNEGGSLVTLSQSGNSVTVTQNDPYQSGPIVLRCNLVSTVCGNNQAIKNDIFVGKPQFEQSTAIIGSSGNEPVNGFSQLNLNVTNSTAQQYHWWIVTLNTSCQNANGLYPPGTIFPKIQTGPNTYATEFYTSQPYVSVRWGNCKGNFVVNVSAVNPCGAIGLDHQTVNVYNPYNGDPCPEDDLVAYPNPSSGGEITVERIPADPCGQIPTLPKGSNAQGNDSNTTTTQNRDGDISNLVEVVNLYGQIIFSETFDSDIFEITGLDNYVGTFIVKVTPLGEPPLTTTLLLE